jgi:hypothetical protein
MRPLERRQSTGLAIAIAVLVGCGGEDRATVTGQVLKHDGTPLIGALVVARSEATGKSANGQTDGDGRYSLGSAETGDGIPAGDYAVIVLGSRPTMDGGGAAATVPARYGDYSKSELSFSVKAGESITFDVKLDEM